MNKLLFWVLGGLIVATLLALITLWVMTDPQQALPVLVVVVIGFVCSFISSIMGKSESNITQTDNRAKQFELVNHMVMDKDIVYIELRCVMEGSHRQYYIGEGMKSSSYGKVTISAFKCDLELKEVLNDIQNAMAKGNWCLISEVDKYNIQVLSMLEKAVEKYQPSASSSDLETVAKGETAKIGLLEAAILCIKGRGQTISTEESVYSVNYDVDKPHLHLELSTAVKQMLDSGFFVRKDLKVLGLSASNATCLFRKTMLEQLKGLARSH